MIRADLVEFELEMYRSKAMELFEENKKLKAQLTSINKADEPTVPKTRGRKSKQKAIEVFKNDVVAPKKIEEEELLED